MTERIQPELPEGFSYEQGREMRMHPDKVHPGDKCRLRFKDPSGGDFFEHTVTVREALKDGLACGLLYVDIHCQTFDREVELRFDKETGCIIQQCGREEQEIGYIVSLQEPIEEVRVPDSTAELERRQTTGWLPADTLIK